CAKVRAEIYRDGEVSVLRRIKPEDRLIALRTVRFDPQRNRRRQASSTCVGGEQSRRHLLDRDAAQSERFRATSRGNRGPARRGVRTDLIVDLRRRDEEERRGADRAMRVFDRNRRSVQRERQGDTLRNHCLIRQILAEDGDYRIYSQFLFAIARRRDIDERRAIDSLRVDRDYARPWNCALQRLPGIDGHIRIVNVVLYVRSVFDAVRTGGQGVNGAN